MVLPIIQSAVAIVTHHDDPSHHHQTDTENDIDIEDEDDVILLELGLQLLETLSIHSELYELVFSNVMDIVNPIMSLQQHDLLPAAYRIISAISEGRLINFSRHASEILRRIVRGASHINVNGNGNQNIRCAVLDTTGQICTNLIRDEMAHAQLVNVAHMCTTVVLDGMQDPSLVVNKCTCRALESCYAYNCCQILICYVHMRNN